MIYLAEVVLVAIVLAIGYLSWLTFETWYDTKTKSRRVEMFICDKHGMLPKTSIVNLGTYLGTNLEMCSICYKHRLQNNNGM